MRKLLGFTGYYRRFVPDYSTVAQALVHLLGKDCKFEWTTACQDAFEALRALLIKAPVLAFPREDLPYLVDTDASGYGISGVLSQNIEGTEYVIAYYSKSLNYCGDGDARAPPITVHTESSPADTGVPSKTIWDLQDENCILSKNSKCSIDFKGFRFHSMETLLCALELEMLGDTKHIRQLAKYTRMEYVRRCAKTRFELAPNTIQDKWLCEQFTAWTQIISARILLYPKFEQALLDSCGSPLCDPNDPVYSNALMSSRKCVLNQMHLNFLHGSRATRG